MRDERGLGLHPNPATILVHPAIVLCENLPLVKNCGDNGNMRETDN